jgi:hypothetical protein
MWIYISGAWCLIGALTLILEPVMARRKYNGISDIWDRNNSRAEAILMPLFFFLSAPILLLAAVIFAYVPMPKKRPSKYIPSPPDPPSNVISLFKLKPVACCYHALQAVRAIEEKKAQEKLK